jgi:hypothetical protein
MSIFGWILITAIFLYFAAADFGVKKLYGKGLIWELDSDQTAEVVIPGSVVRIKASSKKPFTLVANNTLSEAIRFNSSTYTLTASLPEGVWQLTNGNNVVVENDAETYVKIEVRNGWVNKTASVVFGLIIAGLVSLPLWLL